MQEWERLLGVRWPKDACDRSGECCRGAAQEAPWQNLLKHAAEGNITARAFLNQFIPYASQEQAQTYAPHALAASLEISRTRGSNEDEVVLYHCRFLKGQSECQIYEDRPALCRDFPESPFGAIPKCCGYHPAAQDALNKIELLRQELESLKKQRAVLELNEQNL